MIEQAEICYFSINIFQILSTSWSVFLMLITQRQQLLNGNLSIKWNYVNQLAIKAKLYPLGQLNIFAKKEMKEK